MGRRELASWGGEMQRAEQEPRLSSLQPDPLLQYPGQASGKSDSRY